MQFSVKIVGAVAVLKKQSPLVRLSFVFLEQVLII